MTISLAARAAALGLAAGSRSTLGAAAPVLADPDASRRVHAVALTAVVGELVGDKLPFAPSRLENRGPAMRALAGATGGVLVARDRDASPVGCVAAAMLAGAGAVLGTGLGAAWREVAAERGRPDLPVALLEDVAAVLLAAWAVRR